MNPMHARILAAALIATIRLLVVWLTAGYLGEASYFARATTWVLQDGLMLAGYAYLHTRWVRDGQWVYLFAYRKPEGGDE